MEPDFTTNFHLSPSGSTGEVVMEDGLVFPHGIIPYCGNRPVEGSGICRTEGHFRKEKAVRKLTGGFFLIRNPKYKIRLFT
jgi:hypothetical protein